MTLSLFYIELPLLSPLGVRFLDKNIFGGKCMLIFAIIFFGVLSFATAILGALFASMDAIISICALLIFAFIALAIGAKNNRAWTWMFLAVIAMVAVETLAPFAKFISTAISVAIALYGTYQIKRPILAYLERDLRRPISVGGPRIPTWAHTILIFI